MEIAIDDASQIVDDFENLMLINGVSVPKHPRSQDDMLPFWYLMRRVAKGFSGTADEIQPEFTAGVAAHDLAAKVLEVSRRADIQPLVPHLKMLNDGAVHLTREPPGDKDVFNKLIELYWACLLMSLGRDIELDDPKHATGANPDVMVIGDDGNPVRSYAFKTIRSQHTQSVYEHLLKAIDQIECSPAKEGIVVLNLTPRIAAKYWPAGGYYEHWSQVVSDIGEDLRHCLSAVIKDNGQTTIEDSFRGKKAVGSVLALAFVPIVAKHPEADKSVVMPLKVAVVVAMTGGPVSNDLLEEIALANDKMQTVLGR